MDKETKKFIPVIIWVAFGGIIVAGLTYFYVIYASKFISWRVGQEVACSTPRRIPEHNGCWNINTNTPINKANDYYRLEDKNIEGSKLLSKINWIGSIIFLTALIVFGLVHRYRTKKKKA